MPHETRTKPRPQPRRSFISKGHVAPPETPEQQRASAEAEKKRRVKSRGGGGGTFSIPVKGIRQKTKLKLLE